MVSVGSSLGLPVTMATLPCNLDPWEDILLLIDRVN